MKAAERIKMAINSHDMEQDDINKLIALAYYMGREEATKEVSGQYNAVLAEQKMRAEACRYHNMAAAIVGNVKYIYSGDYAGQMTQTFGDDETKL